MDARGHARRSDGAPKGGRRRGAFWGLLTLHIIAHFFGGPGTAPRPAFNLSSFGRDSSWSMADAPLTMARRAARCSAIFWGMDRRAVTVAARRAAASLSCLCPLKRRKPKGFGDEGVSEGGWVV